MAWVIGFIVAVVAVLILRRLYAPPEALPIDTDPDDPLLATARARARATLPEFRRLYPANQERAIAKTRFVTSSGTVEYLWGEVESIEGERIALFLLTPPVSHRGQWQRVVEMPMAELEDWQVTTADGRIYGGFTQRAMIEIARQRWGKLPKKLRELERLYAEKSAEAETAKRP